jgi:hypothetical protein
MANRRLALARRIPAKPDAWFKNLPVFAHTGARLEPRIAGISKSRGRVKEDRALLVRQHPVIGEVVDVAVDLLLREIRLPAKARIHSETGRHFPRVRCVKTGVPLHQLLAVRGRLAHLSELAQQKIGSGEIRYS